jgi:hypothetical protein
VIYLALPGGSDRIVLYYCLMATWTGLGDNTKLFWAVLSHCARVEEEQRVGEERRGASEKSGAARRRRGVRWGRTRRGEAAARTGALRKNGAIWGKTVKCSGRLI